MRHRDGLLCVLMSLVVVGAVPVPGRAAPPAAGTVTYSGTVTAVDRQAGTLVVGEVGPWRVEAGATVITPRRIAVTPETMFTRVRRAAEPAYRADFVETPLAPWALEAGDFVTVRAAAAGDRLVAVEVIVPEVGP